MHILIKLGLTLVALCLAVFLIIILTYSKYPAVVSLRKTLGSYSFLKWVNIGSRQITRNKNQGYLLIGPASSNSQVLGKYRKHIIKKTLTFTNKRPIWQVVLFQRVCIHIARTRELQTGFRTL